MLEIQVSNLTILNTINTYTVTALATGFTLPQNLVYSLNGGAYQVSGSFLNIPLGKHRVTVKDLNNGNEAYREFMLYILDTPSYNDSFTMSYSLDKEGWVSFHDYIPNYIFRTFTKLWSIANLSMVFEQNVGGRGEFYGLIYPSKMDIPINEGKYLNNLATLPDSNSKTLGAVTWYSDVIDDIGNPVYDKTFDWITIRTPYQTSGRLQLKAETNLEKIDYDERYINIRNNENQWSFNQFSDVATKNRRFSKSIMEDFELIKERLSLNNSLLGTIRITSPVVIVRLEFENKDNYTLHLHEVKGMYSTTNVR